MDISQLQPFDVGQMQRVGSRNDGGYVIPTQIPPIDLLISFGLGDNWSFEKDCLKLAIVKKCIVFDHTVGLSTFYGKFFTRLHKTPTEMKALAFRLIVIFRYFTDFSSAKLQHIKKEITRDSNSSTSTNLAAIANEIPTVAFILKADIEGAEYEIIDQINNFSYRIPILILEFHHTDSLRFKFEESLDKLSHNYHICHTHINNFEGLASDGIPQAVEITFIHKNLCTPTKKIDLIPRQELDYPSAPFREDLSIRFR